MANRGTSVDGGWKLVSFGLCVFSGSFGIRSIVLCKCSGKYIDVYFILRITCLHCQDWLLEKWDRLKLYINEQHGQKKERKAQSRFPFLLS